LTTRAAGRAQGLAVWFRAAAVSAALLAPAPAAAAVAPADSTVVEPAAADSTVVGSTPPDSTAAEAAPADSARAHASSSDSTAIGFTAPQPTAADSTAAAVADSIAAAAVADSMAAAAADSVAAAAARRHAAILDSLRTHCGVLRVETIPPGLQVLVDGVAVGHSPIDSLWLKPKTVLVRALAADPRRFDTARDAVPVTIRVGATATVFLDLRPSVLLRSDPEPASVLLVGRPDDLPDSLLGETPLMVKPAWIEGAALRFAREAFADTVLSSAAFLDSGASPPRVALSRTGQQPPRLGPPQRTSFLHKRWVQWSLVGVGAALTGAAVAFHHQGDEWYDQYLASSDVDEIPGLYDNAVRYDRYAAAAVVSGQIFMIGGLVLLLSGQSR
jgi:hypothetical protein